MWSADATKQRSATVALSFSRFSFPNARKLTNSGLSGCFYRWYSNAEVCQILQKFGALVFVGDESLADIYAGFNILLQGNLATGALRESEMTKEQIEKCRCASQFTSASCLPLRITSSEQVEKQNDNKISPGSNACSSCENSPP